MFKVNLIISFLTIFLGSNKVVAQLSGYINDQFTNEPLIGATIFCLNNNTAVVSNNYGFYTVKLNQDTIQHFIIYYSLYRKIDTLLLIKNNLSLNIELSPTNILQEIEVKANKEEIYTGEQLTLNEIKKMPVILGETDIIKSYQLMPGIKQGAEGFSNLLIRGGTSDQVQYILDDMPLYYVNHMGGFLSVFNSDAVSKVELFKNHSPAKYGGRLSGYFDVRMKEGNAQKWSGTISVGLLATRLNFNGPVFKNKSTLQLSFRRLNLDLITTPIIKALDFKTQPSYYFYDGMLKYTHKLNERNKISFSFFNTNDKIKILSKFSDSFTDLNTKFNLDIGWGNTAAAIRLMQNPRPKIFLTHVITGSSYNYIIKTRSIVSENSTETYNATNQFRLGLKNIIFKSNLDYNINNRLKYTAGLQYEFISSGLGDQSQTVKTANENSLRNFNGGKLVSNQLSAYMEAGYLPLSWLSLAAGFNNLLFISEGYTKNFFQPRVYAKADINPRQQISVSYCQNVQSLHLLTNNGAGMPSDVWVSANKFAPPQTSRQLNLSFTNFFSKKKYFFQTDVYYKTSQNLIRYKDGYGLFTPKNNWLETIETEGKGLSYGWENLLKKQTGKLTGFIAYTLSKTTNQFKNLNNGKPFYFNYDRRHELNVFVNYELNKKISFNANFNFATGNALTLPKAIYNVPIATEPNTQSNNSYVQDVNLINTNYVFYYDGINTARTSNFHRLDVAARFTKQKKHGTRVLSVGIYNVYNHHNPFAYYYSYNYGAQQFDLKSISVFQLIPFFSYEYSF